MQLRIEDLKLGIGLDISGGHFAGPFHIKIVGLGAGAVQLGYDSLDIQHDLGNVFLDALDR